TFRETATRNWVLRAQVCSHGSEALWGVAVAARPARRKDGERVQEIGTERSAMDGSSRLEFGGQEWLGDVVWEDGERRFCRIWRDEDDERRQPYLAVFPAGEHPTAESIRRLAHED